MADIFKNLKIDRWYKIFIYLGGILALASLFLPIRWLTNEQVGLLGLALLFIGLGEWKNEKVAFMFKAPNVYTGPAGLFQWPIRKMDFVGFLLLAIGIVCSILFVISVWSTSAKKTEEKIICTQEAKLCPDGSYVGRTGPRCEFATCPNGDSSNDLWNTTTDSKSGITFQYPEKLTSQYISTQEWPPIVAIKAGDYSCTETPQEKSSLSEIISKRMVDDRVYCVDVKHEGAAGSVYSSYVYTTSKNDKLIEVSFSLRYSNCGNNDQEQNQACTNEREAFDLDSTVDRIVRSIKFQ